VPEVVAEVLARRFPGFRTVGAYAPPFRALTPTEDEAIVQMINAARPDIVWVGLGCPKQEHWMAALRARLDAPVLLGVGAAFDFHTGRLAQAPAWMQASGLEWLFRLAREPLRPWHRYLVYNLLFLVHSALRLTRLRRYPLADPPGTGLRGPDAGSATAR